MVGKESAISLRALGAYFGVFVLISTCLSSPPTKVLAQSGKDDSADVVAPPPSQQVSAAFVIEARVYADPVDPNRDVWEAISTSPAERVDAFQRLRLRATQPGATNLYQWSRNGNPFEFSATCYVQFSGQADYNITLQVWSADWRVTDARSAMLYVGPPMQILSTTPPIPGGFSPTAWRVVVGSELWGTSSAGTFGVVSLANPSNLPAVTVMTTPVPSGVRGMAGGNGRLLLARGTAGVAIYNADRYDFRLLGNITSTQLGAASADAVCVVGNTAVVATSSPYRLVAVNVANPAAPQPLWSTPLSNLVEAMVAVGGGAVVLRVSYDNTLYVYDVRSAVAASLVAAVPLPSGVVIGPAVFESTLLMNVSTGSMLLDVSAPLTGGAVQVSAPRIVTPKSWPMAASRDRLYVFTPTNDIQKFDVQPDSPGYAMQTLMSGMVVSSPLLLADIDGSGPAGPILIANAAPYGWRVFRP